MIPTLAALRQTLQPTPTKFLGWNGGCWIQFYDDTAARDPLKALSIPRFDSLVARQKQTDRCAVCYSLQAFGEKRAKEALLCFRNMGVDVDLVSASERRTITSTEIDRRKEEYLTKCLFAFPLQPHWLVETQHGFHAVFRVQPLRRDADIREALAINRRLVVALRGDENAVLLTQVLRVPGMYQYKDPRSPFLCRLLLDNTGSITPYDFRAFCGILEAWELSVTAGESTRLEISKQGGGKGREQRRQDGLLGVPVGKRNATAAAVIGRILCRLPEELWGLAGWGGLKEWNGRNDVPLPERELRSVFESIARREQARREGTKRTRNPAEQSTLLARTDSRVSIQAPSPGQGSSGLDGGLLPSPHSSDPSESHVEH